MTRARILAAVTAIVALVALVAPANAVSSRAAAAPATGRCYNLTYTQTYPVSSSVPYVHCTDKHTTKTFLVKNVPNNIDYKHITNDEMIRVATQICYPKFASTLGSTPENQHLTAYSYIFFSPTAAQRTAGARWVRCDVVLYGGRTLRALPTDTIPFIQGEITDATRRCLVTSDHWYTTCAGAHSYRSSAAYTLTAGTHYRTRDQFLAVTHKLCPGTDFAVWPDRYSWDSGDHVLTCYDRTAN